MLKIIYPPIQLAETEMATSYERAHAEFFSQGESLVILVLSLPNTRGIFVRGDLSNHLENISLVCFFFGLTGEIEGTLCMFNRCIHSARSQIALAKPCDIVRLLPLSPSAAPTYGLL